MILKNVFRLASSGVTFKQSEIRQKMKFSDPDKDDDIIGGAPKQTTAQNSIALNRSTDPAEPLGAFDELDALEAELNEDWEDVMEDALAPIYDILADVSTLEEARDRLAEALPHMGSATLIEGLVKAAFKARSIGDVKDTL